MQRNAGVRPGARGELRHSRGIGAGLRGEGLCSAAFHTRAAMESGCASICSGLPAAMCCASTSVAKDVASRERLFSPTFAQASVLHPGRSAGDGCWSVCICRRNKSVVARRASPSQAGLPVITAAHFYSFAVICATPSHCSSLSCQTCRCACAAALWGDTSCPHRSPCPVLTAPSSQSASKASSSCTSCPPLAASRTVWLPLPPHS
jgi:hypothetical protein